MMAVDLPISSGMLYSMDYGKLMDPWAPFTDLNGSEKIYCPFLAQFLENSSFPAVPRIKNH